jgi:flagellar biosynthesis regulator FlaF
MYFFPASTWIGNKIKVEIDFNFKDDMNIETICNISIKQKGKLAKGISLISLNADSIDYPMNDIKILSINSRLNTVRITSVLSYDNFLNIIRSNNISLQIIIDGLMNECIPAKDFFTLQEEFQNSYLMIDDILK